MMMNTAYRVVTIKDYPTPSPFTGGSTMEEVKRSDYSVFITPELRKKSFPYRSLRPSFEIDLSSVRPYFKAMTKTSLIEDFHDDILPEEMLDYDIVVQMPPKKKYTIELEIKGIKKAEPKIIEPEWI